MASRKRKTLPSSDPHYILSLLEGNSSDESDSDLYSDSDEEDTYFITDSPSSPSQNQSNMQSNNPTCSLVSGKSFSSNSSFQSYNSFPVSSTTARSVQSYNYTSPISSTTTSSFQSYNTSQSDTVEAPGLQPSSNLEVMTRPSNSNPTHSPPPFPTQTSSFQSYISTQHNGNAESTPAFSNHE